MRDATFQRRLTAALRRDHEPRRGVPGVGRMRCIKSPLGGQEPPPPGGRGCAGKKHDPLQPVRCRNPDDKCDKSGTQPGPARLGVWRVPAPAHLQSIVVRCTLHCSAAPSHQPTVFAVWTHGFIKPHVASGVLLCRMWSCVTKLTIMQHATCWRRNCGFSPGSSRVSGAMNWESRPFEAL